MHGMTQDEIGQIQADMDRDEDGFSELERRLVINAARAGNVAAIRHLEQAMARAGAPRSAARENLKQLRQMGPVPEPNDLESDRALEDLKTFLKGLE